MYKYCISIAFFCFLTPKPSTSLWAWEEVSSTLKEAPIDAVLSNWGKSVLLKLHSWYSCEGHFEQLQAFQKHNGIQRHFPSHVPATGSPDGSKSIGQMFKVAPWDRTEASQNTANRKVENDKTTFINPQNVNGARWFQHISTFILLYFLYRFHWTEWTVEVDRVGKTLGNHRCWSSHIPLS